MTEGPFVLLCGEIAQTCIRDAQWPASTGSATFSLAHFAHGDLPAPISTTRLGGAGVRLPFRSIASALQRSLVLSAMLESGGAPDPDMGPIGRRKVFLPAIPLRKASPIWTASLPSCRTCGPHRAEIGSLREMHARGGRRRSVAPHTTCPYSGYAAGARAGLDHEASVWSCRTRLQMKPARPGRSTKPPSTVWTRIRRCTHPPDLHFLPAPRLLVCCPRERDLGPSDSQSRRICRLPPVSPPCRMIVTDRFVFLHLHTSVAPSSTNACCVQPGARRLVYHFPRP